MGTEGATRAPAAKEPFGPGLRSLALALLRVDGDTQHRIAIHAAVVAEYAALMEAGAEFPPIRVWWDGTDYWLSDGFHRLAAAKRAGLVSIAAEVLQGSLADAQWDSYAANSAHGVRRTAEETQRVVRLALRHPNAAMRSNVEIAKHLHIPEATLRRWRKLLSSSSDEDTTRVVTRGGSTYLLRTANIGHRGSRPKSKSRRDLEADLAAMKARSSPQIRRLLNIVGNWALGRATAEACLEALERVLDDRGKSPTPFLSGDIFRATPCVPQKNAL